MKVSMKEENLRFIMSQHYHTAIKKEKYKQY